MDMLKYVPNRTVLPLNQLIRQDITHSWSLINPFLDSTPYLCIYSTTSTLMPYTPQPLCSHPPSPSMQDWLWGTPITNSEGVKSLFSTSCCRGYCHCQLWYTDNKTKCRFTVSQDLAQRDQQCTCNRQG